MTALGFVGNLWATYATGISLMIALALAIAAIYGQVTVNDMILARYTADTWRGRVYAVRYFLTFVSSGAAVSIIAWLYSRGGFDLLLMAVAGIAGVFLAGVLGIVFLVSVWNAHAAWRSRPNKRPAARAV